MVIKNFNQSELDQKIHASQALMSHACTPILVGLASLVLEILLLSKTAKFPFWTMDIVHGHQKLELAQKIMQVEVDDVFMCTKF